MRRGASEGRPRARAQCGGRWQVAVVSPAHGAHTCLLSFRISHSQKVASVDAGLDTQLHLQALLLVSF